jgi:hypothetical protein
MNAPSALSISTPVLAPTPMPAPTPTSAPAPTSSSVTYVRSLKKTNRHLWPLYAEFTGLLLFFGFYVATYKDK